MDWIKAEKRLIKINFTDFGGKNPDGFKFDPSHNIIGDILRKHYMVQLTDDPDYVIYSCDGTDFINYDCIRINIDLEMLVPDFNLTDYAIGEHCLQLDDRYMLFFPMVCFSSNSFSKEKILKRSNFSHQDMEKKEIFASFIHAWPGAQERNAMFDKLNKYKPISSGGRFRNNIGYFIKDKGPFISKSKFHFAMSNRMYNSNEKIFEAFYNKTMPIYWGDPKIGRYFNTSAFINCHDYDSFDDVIARIKEIDNDDDLYVSMMRQPVLAEGFTFEKMEKGLEDFLCHIFDQDYEKAKRRVTTHRAAMHSEIYRAGYKYYNHKLYLMAFIGTILKCIAKVRNKIFGKHDE
jgi:hypothetical protein